MGAVPEPASWALMFAGFGMVGTALRRRKVAAAA
ncbi:MAG TPA: PEPxxWA-CTERM sorting domain-containing protein [Polymorphobacter sp.]|nr:PEPxxWA-CTERM sorting domain-containing protein [Polymorphobacter sp.]